MDNYPFSTPQIIRESTVLFVSKLIMALLTVDFIYIFFRIVVFEIKIPPSFYTDISIFFLAFILVVYVFQIILILTIVLRWVAINYQIEETHLIERKGIFAKKEQIYDLKNIKSVIVRQSLVGRIFGFGTIYLKITSPNITEEICLLNIPKPFEIEKQLKSLL